MAALLAMLAPAGAGAARRRSGTCSPSPARRAAPATCSPAPSVIGHSVDGRPIGLRQSGDPALDGELLVFGCIHGDECAAEAIEPARR